MKKDKKNKPTRATLIRFAGVNLRHKIDRMYVHLERSHKSLLALLDRISIEQYKLMNEEGKFVKVKKRVDKSLEKNDLKIKYVLGDKIFIDTLKKLGKPSLTHEIAENVKPTGQVKKIAKNKKTLMRIMYNSASHLSKNGKIARTPVGKKSYEYSLVEWNKRGAHHNRKSA